MAKLAKARREKTTLKAKVPVQKPEQAVKLRLKPSSAPEKPAVVGQSASECSASDPKKVSQKFREAIEKHKAHGGGWGARKAGTMFGKPARRGRRPKASAEYTPGNNEEEAYVLESDYERIEYDTGIRCQPAGGTAGKEEGGFSLDRVDDFDEELNFDR